jgi:hypothetical protein
LPRKEEASLTSRYPQRIFGNEINLAACLDRAKGAAGGGDQEGVSGEERPAQPPFRGTRAQAHESGVGGQVEDMGEAARIAILRRSLRSEDGEKTTSISDDLLTKCGVSHGGQVR